MFVRHLLAVGRNQKAEGRNQKTEIGSQTTTLLFCLLSSIFCLLLPGTVNSAPPPPVGVVARVYNTARVTPAVTAVALVTATRLLTAGAIGVTWKNCDEPNACATVPVREFVIRLVRSQTIDADGTPFVLGEASIDLHEQAGVLATIYVDRVERMAGLSEADSASLLGRAVAHELGHLLLATNAHSSSGLMRAQWTSKEVRGNLAADWILARKDAEKIRKRLR